MIMLSLWMIEFCIYDDFNFDRYNHNNLLYAGIGKKITDLQIILFY